MLKLKGFAKIIYEKGRKRFHSNIPPSYFTSIKGWIVSHFASRCIIYLYSVTVDMKKNKSLQKCDSYVW